MLRGKDTCKLPPAVGPEDDGRVAWVVGSGVKFPGGDCF